MIELAVDRLKAARLCKEGIGEDFRIADRLGLEHPADADEPLLLLRRPGSAGDDPLHAVLDAGLIGHERIADRGLPDEADDVSRNVGVAGATIGLAQARFGESTFVE